jgi:hypothetical protein
MKFSYIIIIILLLCIPLGMMIEMRKRKKRVQVYLKGEWPVIDLNVSRYRNGIIIFGIGTDAVKSIQIHACHPDGTGTATVAVLDLIPNSFIIFCFD